MAEDLKKAAVANEAVAPRGALADHAAAVLMKALWGARVARPDISVAVTRLARRITKWGEREDKELYRLMCYLFSTPKLKLRGSVHHDTKFWKIRCFADADFVSPDDTSCKSTSGMFVVLQSGPEGEFLYPLSWASRKQSSVARSTPEAELAAASLATFGSLIPLSIIFDAVLPHHVACTLEEDNTAAEQVIGKGYSAPLRYLSRTHKVNLAALSDVIRDGYVSIVRCSSDDMRGDGMTKAFAANKWPGILKLLLMTTV
jgi:hypothetical protein